MISPAPTSWPPKRLTPSRWALESRPLRLDDAPFLCAISVLLRCAGLGAAGLGRGALAGAGLGGVRLRGARLGRAALGRAGLARADRGDLDLGVLLPVAETPP